MQVPVVGSHSRAKGIETIHDTRYRIASNFQGDYIVYFVKNRKEAPKLIFVIFIFVTGSPDLTSGAARPTHTVYNHTCEL